jgi:hypothetical protein
VPGTALCAAAEQHPERHRQHAVATVGCMRWAIDNMRTLVPAQTYLKEVLRTIPDYPFQRGSSLNAAGIIYDTFERLKALERLQQLETIARPNN